MSMRPRTWLQFVWAAAAVVLAVTSLLAWDSAKRLRRELRANQKQIGMLQEQLAQEKLWFDVASTPGARTARFERSPHDTLGLGGRVTLESASHRVVVVVEGAHAPEGREFELWALTPAGPRNLGLLAPDAQGRAVMRLEMPGDPVAVAGFAVSLEPAGGSRDPHAPSGPVVIAAKLPG